MKIILLFPFLLLFECATSEARECNSTMGQPQTSTVRISTSDGSASGVVVAENRVLTVAHALNGLTETEVVFGSTSALALVIAIDEYNDLALLAVETGNIPPMRLANLDLERNELVWAIGFPYARSQKTSLGLYQNMFQGRLYTSAHINSGSSGGGLFRCHTGSYELAGIIHGYIAFLDGEKIINSGDSTSVPAKQIRAFIKNADQLHALSAL